MIRDVHTREPADSISSPSQQAGTSGRESQGDEASNLNSRIDTVATHRSRKEHQPSSVGDLWPRLSSSGRDQRRQKDAQSASALKASMIVLINRDRTLLPNRSAPGVYLRQCCAGHWLTVTPSSAGAVHTIGAIRSRRSARHAWRPAPRQRARSGR